MKLSCHPSSIMCRYFSKQRWQWLAGILAAWWILRREVWIRLNKKKQKNRLCPVYCWNWHCENNPWQCLWFAIISFSSPTKIIDQSTTVSLLYHHFKCWGTQCNLCWQVQLFLPHIPLLLLIKFDLYEDIADVLFISALWDTPQVLSGCRDLYVPNKKTME